MHFNKEFKNFKHHIDIAFLFFLFSCQYAKY